MKIAFIGAGKVANAFGVYLRSKELGPAYVYSSLSISAQKMTKLTFSSYCESVKELVEKSDLVFITTTDSEIRNVAGQIAKEFTSKSLNLESPLADKTFVHMSGALTSEELISLKELGGSTYSLHPLQSFSDHEKAVRELGSTVFSLEGDEPNENIKEVVRKMENEIINLSKDNKVKYHIAACISSNYLITLLNSSVELFGEIGIEHETAIKALMPLVNGAVSNFKKFSSEDALTGPIKRGDLLTIKSHVDDLEGSESKDLYKLMGSYTALIAEKSGTDKSKLEEIRKLLK